ncbi:asparagine synthase (glutamine-hydrolyzing) [Vallitalea guaymasensis]|uniref:asparagine synthase (glutamine-hydrolyzing) n=1 Tax=Vallitalea guaymasensis TaxID=1185412 RepID=UPI000DE38C3C|nr:asparagine synthase (glutamine-hydrolyzing) [Vallitalea guaymasensis]
MCGICGYVDLKDEDRIDRNVLLSMINVLEHRGPDDTGYHIERNIALGFSRLSIVDLEGGHQPLNNENDTIFLICNGEIFNYKELKKELIEKGHTFRSKCDVEVILHLYEEYDTDFINYLNGQFAFVIYDSRKKKFICARDNVGIAPFYYTVVDKMFIFGSEIKAILQNPYVKRQIDLTGLDQIMNFPGMASPRTLFKNIKSLEPGHFLSVDRTHGIVNTEYWDLIYQKEDEKEEIYDEEYYIEHLNDLLTKSVKRRLQADVPVGFYLSGGLDSALIAGKIYEVGEGIQRNSYSVDFNDKSISEGKYQRLMAGKVNSIHHEIRFDLNSIADRIKKAVYHSESALKESYNTASLALSSAARSDNVKVILTGEGADELFGGYIGYRFDQLKSNQKQSQPMTDELKRENEIREQLWGDENFLYEKYHYSYSQKVRELYSKEANAVYDEFNCYKHPLINKERIKDVSIFNKRSYVDFKLRMGDHLLTDHGDRMALANSVEARYPFLDKDVIEFVKKIPTSMKLKAYKEKYILKRTAEKVVPMEIIKRPKFAFVAPGSSDLLKMNNEYFMDLLSYEKIKRQGIFNADTIERYKKQYLKDGFKLNVPYDDDMLIIALTFNIFLDQFGINSLS